MEKVDITESVGVNGSVLTEELWDYFCIWTDSSVFSSLLKTDMQCPSTQNGVAFDIIRGDPYIAIQNKRENYFKFKTVESMDALIDAITDMALFLLFFYYLEGAVTL